MGSEIEALGATGATDAQQLCRNASCFLHDAVRTRLRFPRFCRPLVLVVCANRALGCVVHQF